MTTSAELFVRLEPGSRISGEVIFAHDSRPVRDGSGHVIQKLAASAFSSSPQGLRAARYMCRNKVPLQVDDHGRFSFITRSPLVAIEVSGTDYTPTFSEPISTKPGENVHVVVRVHRGVSLQGRVYDPDGAPVEGARVSIYPAIEDRYPDHLYYNHHIEPEAITDASGRFHIENASRHYRGITVRHADFPVWADYQELVPSTKSVKITLKHGLRVRGRLSGNALPADVKANLLCGRRKFDVNVSDDGSFESVDLPAKTTRGVLNV
ncbi:MAG: hypothetical protein AAF517_27725, partial [Planctomycetota bacterium]